MGQCRPNSSNPSIPQKSKTIDAISGKLKHWGLRNIPQGVTYPPAPATQNPEILQKGPHPSDYKTPGRIPDRHPGSRGSPGAPVITGHPGRPLRVILGGLIGSRAYLTRLERDLFLTRSGHYHTDRVVQICAKPTCKSMTGSAALSWPEAFVCGGVIGATTVSAVSAHETSMVSVFWGSVYTEEACATLGNPPAPCGPPG